FRDPARVPPWVSPWGRGLLMTSTLNAGNPRASSSLPTPAETATALVALLATRRDSQTAILAPGRVATSDAAAWNVGKKRARLLAAISASAASRLTNSGALKTAS